ncbi:hypothetical protein [Pseudomonas aeruginosa]|uniref:hypothetical protein n=1 Tax=Pseudomonas aeruginosa TaxID=287 RepID=UPI0020440412|nr:hypothetical protein [Pseudomonas aeruginosa]MCM4075451.1 hypothetical protein [Pseudomonas aeruginosa]MCM4094337.1 hypothetical protein [Pseudomonas aeruginosa]MCM4108046.1 hypothetical protein [Pseudomonas aeruginosa]MCM4121338.1 hypothetical protein [Pseudomonas aeruginosa]
MSKHTPGPWGQDKWGSLQTEGGQDVLLRGITTISAGSDERIAEAEANTRLISAAPELLEALQDLDALRGPFPPSDEAVEDAWRKASAAIAKATGQ